jgi:predicted HD superfamily hydrolase involved in NAD metabolism
METARYLAFLQQSLTPYRLRHSVGVQQVMAELAAVYALDHDQAVTAGLLHDVAKDLGPAQRAELIARATIKIRHPSEHDYVHYLHGPVGAYLVHQALGVSDALVLEAIATHTYYGWSDAFHAPLCWCLRFADLLEPSRDWRQVRLLQQGLPRLREAAYAGRLDEAAFLQTGWLLSWYAETGKPVHPNMTRTFLELAERLGVDGRYLESPAAG